MVARSSLALIPAPDEWQVPDALLPDEAVEALVVERQPRFVPVDGASASGEPAPRADGTVGAAGHGGVVQLRLSNGIKVNYRRTDNEPRGAMLRLVAAGGRATEGQGAGPLGVGVMALGTRTLSEAGTVGAWSREQVGGRAAAGRPGRRHCQQGRQASSHPRDPACTHAPVPRVFTRAAPPPGAFPLPRSSYSASAS